MELKTPPSLSLNYLVGVDIPIYIRDEINYFLQEKLKAFKKDLQFFNIHDYHFTIAYIGKITEEQRSRLITVSDLITVPPFTVEVSGLGFYPPGRNPKFLWLGLDSGREKMNIFAENVRIQITNKAGLIPKDSFSPHITVAKINRPSEELNCMIQQNWKYPFGAFQVDSFHLYRITKNGYSHNHKILLKKNPRLVL
jgi:2'-5' RNA ligase